MERFADLGQRAPILSCARVRPRAAPSCWSSAWGRRRSDARAPNRAAPLGKNQLLRNVVAVALGNVGTASEVDASPRLSSASPPLVRHSPGPGPWVRSLVEIRVVLPPSRPSWAMRWHAKTIHRPRPSCVWR